MKRALLLFLAPVLAAADASAEPTHVDPILRVCADPAGLPASNEKGEGFENRIAEIVAKELNRRVEYTWWAQRRGFLRSTLNAGTCDVVIGVPVGLDMVRTTKPYWRSTFAFVTRKSADLGGLTSIGDARLRTLRIGVPLAGDDGANPAPIHALAKRGITSVRGFPLYAEIGRTMPAAAEEVAKGTLDVAILWGPVAGAAVKKSSVPLVAIPVAEESDEGRPFAFSMAMGVRKRDEDLARALDAAIEKQKEAITKVLRDAGVPLLPERKSHAVP